MITEFLTDRINMVNIGCGTAIMWLKFIASFFSALEGATTIITFISVCFLCGYNAIRFLKEYKNRAK